MTNIYNRIYDFCKVRNLGNVFENGEDPTPRVEFLMELLDELGIEYELDYFAVTDESLGFNLNLIGDSDQFVVAHHDINNPNIDNANDNSCSVINAIAIKMIKPDLNVSLLDGEEFGGFGSKHLSKRIKNGDFGRIKWVLNFELTGKGGESFFIGDYPGPLSTHIKSLFDCPVVSTPFNDSIIFRKYGIDSVVINPLPITEKKTPILNSKGEYLDIGLLYNCHSPKDTVSTISVDDMKAFVEKVALQILS